MGWGKSSPLVLQKISIRWQPSLEDGIMYFRISLMLYKERKYVSTMLLKEKNESKLPLH